MNTRQRDRAAKTWFDDMLQAQVWRRHGVPMADIIRRLGRSRTTVKSMLRERLPEYVQQWLCRAGCPIRLLEKAYPGMVRKD